MLDSTTSELHNEKKSRQKVIYGVDNRQDFYQLDDQSESKIKEQCNSIVSLFNNDDSHTRPNRWRRTI